MKTAPELIEAIQNNERKKIEVNGFPIYIYCNEYMMSVASDEDHSIADYFFKAECENNVLRFDIHTKNGKKNVPKPGIYASELLKLSIEYFTKLGNKITAIRARWSKTSGKSDNYVQYMDALGQGMSDTSAAQNTWTGKIAKELGFTHVYKVPPEISDNFVDFIFSKKLELLPWLLK